MSTETKQTMTTLTPAKVRPLEYAGQTIIFPVVGEQTFSDKGTLEVETDKAEALILATKDSFDFYEHVSDGSNKVKSKRQELSEEEAKIKADLDLLDDTSLIELAKDSGIEPSALMNMTNGKIKKELIKKFREAEKANDAESEDN